MKLSVNNFSCSEPNLEITAIKGGLGVTATIKNTGDVDATDVNWKINIKGGILGRIDKTFSDTIDIDAGQSETVSTGLFFGLSSIDITTTVDDVEEKTEGIQIIILTIIKDE